MNHSLHRIRGWASAGLVVLAAGSIGLTLAPAANASTHYGTAMVTTQRMSDATLKSTQHGNYSKGQKLTLSCYKRGQSVQGYYSGYVGNGGWDNIWYRVSDGYYVADVDISTGVNGPVTGACTTATTPAKPAPSPASSSSTRVGRLNARIVRAANAVRDGSYGGQCAVWVENIIRRAGGPSVALGYPSQYQAAWSRYATPVRGWQNVRPGDIVQFYSAVTGQVHTGIIMRAGSYQTAVEKSSNKLIKRDGRWVGDERVHTAPFSQDRSYFGANNYRIWRMR